MWLVGALEGFQGTNEFVSVGVDSPRLLDGLAFMGSKPIHAPVEDARFQLMLPNELFDRKILPVFTVFGPFNGVADVVR